MQLPAKVYLYNSSWNASKEQVDARSEEKVKALGLRSGQVWNVQEPCLLVVIVLLT